MKCGTLGVEGLSKMKTTTINTIYPLYTKRSDTDRENGLFSKTDVFKAYSTVDADLYK